MPESVTEATLVVDGATTGTVEGEAEGTEGTTSTITSLEDAQKEIAKLRKENASKRVKSKEDADAAAMWQKHVESQKTELEKANDRAAQAEAKAAKLELETLRREVADKFNLDSDLVDFITGDSQGEMEAKAKVLADKGLVRGAKNANDLGAGASRGTPLTGPKKGDGGSFLEALSERNGY